MKKPQYRNKIRKKLKNPIGTNKTKLWSLKKGHDNASKSVKKKYQKPEHVILQ